MELLGKSSPRLAEDLVPTLIPHSVLLKILQNLLLEQVPIRDIRTIAEAIAEVAPRTQDPGTLTSVVKIALARSIVQGNRWQPGHARGDYPGLRIGAAADEVGATGATIR